MILVSGGLITAGVYLILQRQMLKIIIGTGILSHAAHLLILTMGKLSDGAPPIIKDGIEEYVDPLPQALILTSIVISFGVTSYLLVLAYRAYKTNQTDNMEQLRGTENE
jgi:multicomponent Na+:H+ antiporter subunit C